MSNSNFQQGELVVDSISIVNPEKESIDILTLTSNITIFEAIDKPFLSGRLTVFDGIDLIKNFKLVGQESVTIKIRQRENSGAEFSTDKFSIDKVFRIYSVTDVINVNQNTRGYAIHFVDPKFFTCQKTKINQTLRGSYSDMLLTVLSENAGFKTLPKTAFDKWDKTEPGNNQVVVPNWNVNKFIRFVVANADLAGNKTWKNSMFFYQTLNGEFRFDSFQSMCSRVFPLAFDTLPRNNKPTEDTNINAEQIGLNTQIIEYTMPQRFNTMKGLTQGAYASILKTYDPIRKLEEENIYSITKVFERGNDATPGHVSKFPIIRTSEPEVIHKADDMISGTESPNFSEEVVDLAPDISYNSFVLNKVNMTNAFSDEAKLIDSTSTTKITQQLGQEYRDTGHLERRALMSLLEQNVVKVQIPFRSDMSVGTCVKLSLPTPELKGDNSTGDEMQDSNYLIGKMTMSIEPLKNKGTLTLQCIKESYGVDIKSYKPMKDYKGPENT